MILETQRLILRPWELSDAQRLYALAKDPEVGPPAGWSVHTDVENSRVIIEQVLQDEGTFAVVLKENNLLIGCAGWKETEAHENLHELELGYWLGRDYWGHGYIPEAVDALIHHCFETLDQRRLWCGHYAENAKSRRVIEKSGFRFQFEREEEVELLNERRTASYYSLEREEWAGRPPFGTVLHAVIDRPMGSRHPKHQELVYPVNYGYIPNRFAPDGEEQDVYILGVDHPVEAFTGQLIAVIHRTDDVEDKWVLAPEGVRFSTQEILELTAFQEQYFHIEIVNR